MKIHGSVKKDLVNRYVNHLTIGSWRFIETFSITHAVGQFRPTTHLYKLNFVNGTYVAVSDPKSDSNFLSLTKFTRVEDPDLNTNMLIDVIGQVVNIGDMETVEVNNKPTHKLVFEMQDERDERLSCTLRGSFADKVFGGCHASNGVIVVCILRFVKVKTYKGSRYLSNSYDASQVHINPAWIEVDNFIKSLPNDGLSLAFRESVPKLEIVVVTSEDTSQYSRKTIAELIDSVEVDRESKSNEHHLRN
ncbi:PREDICTED: uncharacterized protein LOC104720320 [Camelina sativa]|uniref:Uncharacterized protein LOC104720320 n=1 Tax=Camelina sativa TaxID=90675 RepID=A0ABM1QHM9_CAMSA|nr:PREDICTED: uncharacterized protein LOC104720320 [Camelina sativa]